MMGRLNHDQGQLFYSFHLDEVVPDDHLVREIAAVLDLSWVHRELAAYYPRLGRPSIDPELMIRMLSGGWRSQDDDRAHRGAFRPEARTACSGDGLWVGRDAQVDRQREEDRSAHSGH